MTTPTKGNSTPIKQWKIYHHIDYKLEHIKTSTSTIPHNNPRNYEECSYPGYQLTSTTTLRQTRMMTTQSSNSNPAWHLAKSVSNKFNHQLQHQKQDRNPPQIRRRRRDHPQHRRLPLSKNPTNSSIPNPIISCTNPHTGHKILKCSTSHPYNNKSLNSPYHPMGIQIIITNPYTLQFSPDPNASCSFS